MKAQLVRVSTAAVLVMAIAGVPAAMACGGGHGGRDGGHHSYGGQRWHEGGNAGVPGGGILSSYGPSGSGGHCMGQSGGTGTGTGGSGAGGTGGSSL